MIKIENNATNNETVDLFELEGKVYTIPAKPRASLVLRYMKSVREHGEEYASSEMLEGLLGKDNYAVLESCEHLTIGDFQAIMEEAQRVVMGNVEAATGKE